MDLYNEAFRGTGKYGEEKISGRMEPKAELALFNLFWMSKSSERSGIKTEPRYTNF